MREDRGREGPELEPEVDIAWRTAGASFGGGGCMAPKCGFGCTWLSTEWPQGLSRNFQNKRGKTDRVHLQQAYSLCSLYVLRN